MPPLEPSSRCPVRDCFWTLRSDLDCLCIPRDRCLNIAIELLPACSPAENAGEEVINLLDDASCIDALCDMVVRNLRYRCPDSRTHGC
jgi:hypothetical protein